MNLEEFKKLDEEGLENLMEKDEDEYDELMAEAFHEAYEKYPGSVFEAGCCFFILEEDGVREISNDVCEWPRGSWFPDIVSGPSEEETKKVDELMEKYGFNEELFSDISDLEDDEDWDSESVADYIDGLDKECEDGKDKADRIRTILKLQEGIKNKTVPFESVNEIYDILKRYELNPDELYYEWEGEYVDLYENISDFGEERGEYDGLEDYEWLEILNNIGNYEVKP